MESQKLCDLYIPRKCAVTNRIIHPKDHASIQLAVGVVNENGVYTGEKKMYPISGFVRSMGESDDSINHLLQKDGFLKKEINMHHHYD